MYSIDHFSVSDNMSRTRAPTFYRQLFAIFPEFVNMVASEAIAVGGGQTVSYKNTVKAMKVGSER